MVELDRWHLGQQLNVGSDLAAVAQKAASAAGFDIHEVIGTLNHWTMQCNGLVEVAAPWKLAKDDSRGSDLDAVLYSLAESLRIIAILIAPVTPTAAHGIFDQLNWKMELSGNEERFALADAEWGRLPDGHVVGKPTPLFPRIETPEA